MKINKIIIPEGWEVEKIENGEITLKESKSKETLLPKTWGEYYKILGKGEYISNNSNINYEELLETPIKVNRNIIPKGLGKPLLAFCQLLVCREVYRQGWKPDWNDCMMKYCIFYDGEICAGINYNEQRVLSFQTKEARDKFLKNFRDLIEKAKELI